ncbi:DUF1870 family protein [Candidatus Pacearchaeota archaeon]|nr:DUF1870 family protein [Candidatus Pacearchaeota archaeon]
MTKEELRVIRKELGLTIDRMAKELNTPRKTYENWEYGARRIPGIIVVALKSVK